MIGLCFSPRFAVMTITDADRGAFDVYTKIFPFTLHHELTLINTVPGFTRTYIYSKFD